MIRGVNSFANELSASNPSYNFPKITDLKCCIFLFFIILFAKIILESAFLHISDKILAKKYKNPKDERLFLLGKIYRRKLASHMFKGLFYLGATIYGFYALHNLNYFPTSLLGKGQMRNLYTPGYPQSFYYERSIHFNYHIFICLSYVLCDLVLLVFINERQNDFINMLLHHLVTISMLFFSYLTNYSGLGSIVLFVHNQSDIFVH